MTIEIKEFTCPVCGSHRWGSYMFYKDGYEDPSPGAVFGRGIGKGVWKGACHGPGKGVGCAFNWERVNDARYMKGTGEVIGPILAGAVTKS